MMVWLCQVCIVIVLWQAIASQQGLWNAGLFEWASGGCWR